MNTQYLEFPQDLLNQIGTNIKLTRQINYAHGVGDIRGNHLHYCTMYKGSRYITSQEQKEQAQKLHQENKQKYIDSLGNKLVFVGMGADYEARYNGDVCNHRIRTEIVNPEGKNYFIEVCRGIGEGMHVTHVVDRDQEKHYEKMQQYYRDKIMLAGGFHKVGKGHPMYDKWREFQNQPYYWFKRELWESTNLKYTLENVIKLVNSVFLCRFEEIEIDSLLLSTDDYKSQSPK